MKHNPAYTITTNRSNGCNCEKCRRYSRERQTAHRRAKGIPERHTPTHGTLAKYSDGCRCSRCTVAHADYQASHYHAIKGQVTFTHGTLYGYNYGHCRCDDCRAAKREARKRTA